MADEKTDLNQVLAAAQALGCEALQEYDFVEGQFFVFLKIVKDGVTIKSYPTATTVKAVLADLNKQREISLQQVNKIDKEIKKVNSVGTAKPAKPAKSPSRKKNRRKKR